MITAYLRFNGFEKKLRLTRLDHIIKIPVFLPPTTFFDDIVSGKLNVAPILTFEIKKQLTKYTYEYRLVRIS